MPEQQIKWWRIVQATTSHRLYAPKDLAGINMLAVPKRSIKYEFTEPVGPLYEKKARIPGSEFQKSKRLQILEGCQTKTQWGRVWCWARVEDGKNMHEGWVRKKYVKHCKPADAFDNDDKFFGLAEATDGHGGYQQQRNLAATMFNFIEERNRFDPPLRDIANLNPHWKNKGYGNPGKELDTGRKSKVALMHTLEQGDRVHFLLDGMDINQVLDRKGAKDDYWTSHELRFLYRHRVQYGDQMFFYLRSESKPPPWLADSWTYTPTNDYNEVGNPVAQGDPED